MRWTITREFDSETAPLACIDDKICDDEWPVFIDKDRTVEPQWNTLGVGRRDSRSGFLGRGTMIRNEPLRALLLEEAKQLLFCFRCVDDDGMVYAEGRSDDRDSEEAFEPIDWYASDSGAIHIYYQQDDGSWTLL